MTNLCQYHDAFYLEGFSFGVGMALKDTADSFHKRIVMMTFSE